MFPDLDPEKDVLNHRGRKKCPIFSTGATVNGPFFTRQIKAKYLEPPTFRHFFRSTVDCVSSTALIESRDLLSPLVANLKR